MEWQWKRIGSFDILGENGVRATKRNDINEVKNGAVKKWPWPKHGSHGGFGRIGERENRD